MGHDPAPAGRAGGGRRDLTPAGAPSGAPVSFHPGPSSPQRVPPSIPLTGRHLAAGLALAVAAASGARAQEGPRLHLMGRVVPALSWAGPMPGGGDRAEVRLTQPVAMLDGRAAFLRWRATLDLEGLTIPGGELTPGAWGEGFIDRRHPHTYAHELMLWAAARPAGARGPEASLALGKGFVPFGSPDPMVRPFLRYPVNHHWAQLLERAQVAGAVRFGAVVAEASAFNGDEPERPGEWPNLRRFGDSWAGRLTASPRAGLELQVSHARVRSPEHRPGAGRDMFKWSVSGRWEGQVAGLGAYAFAEWARSTEAGGAFRYPSVLAELALTRRSARLAWRGERTERPEEERLFGDPFRSVRPHLDDNVLGQTRWVLHTVALSLRARRGPLGGEPFIEVTLGRVGQAQPGLFDPVSFYRRTAVRTLSLGARLDLGGPMTRMGRYGVLDAHDAAEGVHRHHHPRQEVGP